MFASLGSDIDRTYGYDYKFDNPIRYGTLCDAA